MTPPTASRIVPGKRVRITGPSIAGHKGRIGEVATVITDPEDYEDTQTVEVGVPIAANGFIFPLSSLAPLDDEPEVGKGEFKPGDEVWVRAKVDEVSEPDGDCWVDLPFDQFARIPLSDLRKA